MSVITPAGSPGTGAPSAFGPLRQVDAGLLNVGYAEAGPADGPAVLLLHGWPYDIHAFAEVVAAAGRGGLPRDRAVPARLRDDALPAPTTRSATASRPLSPSTRSRSWTPSDRPGDRRRLRLGRAVGRRRRRALPERVRARLRQRLSDRQPGGHAVPLPPEAELRGGTSSTSPPSAAWPATTNRREFNRLIWRLASPKWDFDDATFERSAASFDNPDHVDIAIHNYRWRLAWPTASRVRRPRAAARRGAGDRRADDHARGRRQRRAPPRPRRLRRVLRHLPAPDDRGGIGHNLPQEAPGAFAQAVVEVDSY